MEPHGSGALEGVKARRRREGDEIFEMAALVQTGKIRECALAPLGLSYGPRLRPRWGHGEVFRCASSAGRVRA